MAIKKKTSTRTAKTARPKTASSIRGGTNKTAKKRSSQSFAVIALVASVVFMSIGFAAYATTLYIGGGSDGQGANNATVKASKWDIHWAGESGETTGLLTKTTDITSTAGSCTITRTSGTVITFDITLGEPGDKCVFNVDAVNGGTIDALLTTITMSDITTYANYLDYKVKYDTTTYTGTTALTMPVRTRM